MKALVLAEKPSVAKEIARVLGCNQKQKSYFEGSRYVVTWALGHLITLAEPDDYDPKYKTWNMDDLPILPKQMRLKVIKETSHQFKAISQLAKRQDLNELIIATDAGREGELVARWIMEMVRWKKPFKRLWISSQTDKAIKEGFAHLKPGNNYDHLYQSAVCRAEADWLIGLNVTRALTCIKQFQPQQYWTIQVDYHQGFTGIWRNRSNQDSRLFDQTKAEAIRQKIEGKKGQVIQVKTVEKVEPQPLAYDLTELQRDANKRYGFSAKQTSNILQRLYEQHKLVTYPRTDSRYLTTDMIPTLKGRIESIATGTYESLVKPLLAKHLPISKRVVDDSKVTDHHAIIPTEEPLRLGLLSNDEKKLYDLIARRFIALFYPVHRYDRMTVVVEIAGERFHSTGKIIKDQGWKAVYGKDQVINHESEDDEAPDLAEQTLPPLQTGNQLSIQRCRTASQYTKPPARHTEASLLTLMEKNNLGTPATRADIIEKLLKADSIERQGNQLLPTRKGLQLLELVADELRSPELTAAWEVQLEQVARGRGDMEAFLQGIRQHAGQLVKTIKQSESVYKPHNVTGSRCPQCGQFLQEFKGKRGKVLVCPDRACGYRRAAERQLANKRCPRCHKKMEIRTGKAGKYFQCKPCNVIEMAKDEGNARLNRKTERNLIKQYSANQGLTSSLGDALKAAIEHQKKDK